MTARSAQNSSQKTLIILVLVQVIAFFPFRFTDGMEDRDSYRMLLGILDSFARGTHFNSPLLYNRQVSFGYYTLIYALISPSGHAPNTVIAAMNAVSFVAAVLFVIPFYFVVERLFDRNTAIAASIVLAIVPVWWNGALYGHPTMPGMLPFFCALALLARSKPVVTPIVVRLSAILLMAIALSFRFDLLLLFPALAAVIWYRYLRNAKRVAETAFYITAAVALFKLAQFALPPVHGGPPPDSIFVLLHRFQDPSRVFSLSREAIIKPMADMGGAFGPLLLILNLPAFWILLRSKDFARILFTIGVIVPSVLFWFPNPSPVRHYLPMAPATSVATAITGLWLISKITRTQLPTGFAWCCGAVLGVVCTAVSIGLHYAPGPAGKFESPFWFRFTLDEYQSRASRLADHLVSLRGPRWPVLVLCDSNFVAARMETLSGGVRVRPSFYSLTNYRRISFQQVDYDGRTFTMLEQSFYPDVVELALDRLNLYSGYPVLVDPYNTAVRYSGKRLRAHVERVPGGERIQVDGVKH